MERLLTSRERREAMGAAARAHVAAHFSLGATAQQTFEVYEELLKGHSS